MNNNILLVSLLLNHQTPVEEPGINSISAYLAENGYNVRIAVLKDDTSLKETTLSPILIGITVYNETIHVAKSVCRKLKAIYKNSYICLGGYAPTYYPEEVLNEISDADFIISGEGELAFLQLADFLSGKNKTEIENVGSLIFRHNGNLLYNKKNDLIDNLDILPFSDRSIISKYNSSDTWVLTSRGCSRNCGFCCNNDFWKREGCNWRGHSVHYVIDELRTLTMRALIRGWAAIAALTSSSMASRAWE